MMRDVKTTGMVRDGTGAGPELPDPSVLHTREVGDAGVRSIVDAKRNIGPIRDINLDQRVPDMENRPR